MLVAGLAYDTLREHRLGFQNFTAAGTGVNLGVQGALRRDDSNRVVNLDPYAQIDLKLSTRWALNVGVRRSTVRFDSVDQYIAANNGNNSGSARCSASLPVAAVSLRPHLTGVCMPLLARVLKPRHSTRLPTAPTVQRA